MDRRFARSRAQLQHVLPQDNQNDSEEALQDPTKYKRTPRNLNKQEVQNSNLEICAHLKASQSIQAWL